MQRRRSLRVDAAASYAWLRSSEGISGGKSEPLLLLTDAEPENPIEWGDDPMKLLAWRPPTAEQLKIIGATALGTEIIRGAAGSGKTTTALLRLRNLSDMFEARHKRLGIEEPVRILVLTFNRTLCGYVRALAEKRAKAGHRRSSK